MLRTCYASSGAGASSYCMLAHGSVLAQDFYSAEEVEAIVNESTNARLDETDNAIMQFAKRVVRDATSITEADVDRLRGAVPFVVLSRPLDSRF